MSKGMSPLPSPFIPEGACISPPSGTSSGGSIPTAVERSIPLNYCFILPPLIIDELFFPSHTTLRSIENNLILVFPPSLILPHFPMLHLYDTKQLVVKEMLEAGVEEVLLNWVWSTLSLQNEGNVSLHERTIHKYITCSVSFFRLEQFFSLLWETQNHSCVFSAWCAD